MKVNGARLLGATIVFPRVGVWHADLDIDADDASAFDRVTIETDAGTLLGRVKPGGASAFVGRVKAKVAGGACGFSAWCDPKFYQSIPASTVLRDALAVGGETLSGTVTEASGVLPFWTRHESTVGEAFEECVAHLGLTWRVLDDGSVWAGKETWPEAALGAQATILTESPAERTAVMADALTLRPGVKLDGRHVGRVELALAPEGARTTVWFQDSDADGDPVREALTKIVRQMTRTIDFLAMYPATVVSQSGDGSLELKLASDRMPSMSRVPIRYGVPGIRAEVRTGSAVAVEFERGSPAAPVATVWDSESVKALTVKADKVIIDAPDVESQKGGRPLARVGDPVQVICTAPGTPAVGQIMAGNPRHRG